VFLFPSSDGEFTFKETNNKLHRVIEAEKLGFVLPLRYVLQTRGKSCVESGSNRTSIY